MIQRVQTIWLLLAAIAGFLITQIALFTGTLLGQVVKRYHATQNLVIFAVAILAALLAFVTIFLYKNRKLQTRFTILCMLLSLSLIGLEVWAIDNFEKADQAIQRHYYYGSLLPVAMFIFLFLAATNIRKDEKLVKSLDRLR